VALPEIVDLWSEHSLYLYPDLCEKQLILNHSISGLDFDYKYKDPELTLKQPGLYSYLFYLVDYEQTRSRTFEFFVEPCSVTSFINNGHDKLVEVNGLSITLPLIPDYWSTHELYDNPNLCTK
jgi:hypothetical protein